MSNSPLSPQSQLSKCTTLLTTALDEAQRQERHPSVDVLWCLCGQSIVRSPCRGFPEGSAFRGGGVGASSSPTSVKFYIYIFFYFSIFVAGCRLRSMSVKGEFRNRVRDM
jgi:hypothetical protein